MADYKVTLTSAGAALMAKCLSGQALVFTAVQLGDGDAAGSFLDMMALVSVKKALPVSAISRRDNTAIVKAVLDYTSITEDFQWKEVGLIARDPETDADVLYCYGNAGDKGDWITGGVAATAKRINITALVSSVAQVTARIDNTKIYASIEALEGKADLVDGKVPAAQLPEMDYDPAGAAQVVQGNLQKHIADKGNPHGVTAAQVGAVPATGGTFTGEVTVSYPHRLNVRHLEGANNGELFLNYNNPNQPVYANGTNQVIHTGNIGSQSVNYANGAGFADTAGNANAVGGRAAGTVLSEIDSLKTSVANGKALIASAISDKGVSTGAGADFGTMANNIRAIATMQTADIVGYGFYRNTWSHCPAPPSVDCKILVLGSQNGNIFSLIEWRAATKTATEIRRAGEDAMQVQFRQNEFYVLRVSGGGGNYVDFGYLFYR